MEHEQKYLGYLKYDGKLVESGYFDARKSAQALLGFDDSLRYFIYQESSVLRNLEFEIPVKIEKGSWLAYIPHNIQDWIVTAAGLGVTAYAGAAAKKMAENDFKDIGLKTIFKSAFNGIVWVIKIASHLGTMTKKKLDNVKFRNDNEEIGIVNDNGEILYVPRKYIDLYINCPEKLFAKLAQLVESERELEVALVDSDSEKVRITYSQKQIFAYDIEEDDEILFPELENGKYVELQGHVTRGNQNTNSIGFLYCDHILSCYPQEGNIIRHKLKLFSACLIKGFVDRLDKKGIMIEKKPRIIFIDLVPIKDTGPKELKLFEDEENE
jgi:hypothetical protein